MVHLFGLRRNEIRRLQDVDISWDPNAGELDCYGHLNVQFGKASKSSDFKKRKVLALFFWGNGIIQDWIQRGRTSFAASRDLFPTERGTFVSESALNSRFRQLNHDIGITFPLTSAVLYHLIGDSMDALFVQH